MAMKLIALALVIVGNLGDYWSTRVVVGAGHAVEGNPIVAFLGLLPAKVLAVVVFAVVIGLETPKSALETGAIVLGVYALLTLWNLYFLLS